MADVPSSEGGDPDESAVVDRFPQLLSERARLSDVRIRGAVWASVFRIHRRLADEYRSGRVLLAGDAVHIHSPFGGQGMLTGIGDAENLAWKLALVAAGQADEALLDSYQAERRPLAKDVLRGTTMNTRLFLGENPVVRLLRDRVVVSMLNRPWVQRRMTGAASQLWVSYRRGPLAAGSGGRIRDRPRPGDRVPDLTAVREDGGRTRLHAELGGRWALLVPDGDAGREAAGCVTAVRRRLDELFVTLTRASDGSDDVLLVRPDTHLAWRGPPGAVGSLGQWLEGVLQRGRAARGPRQRRVGRRPRQR